MKRKTKRSGKSKQLIKLEKQLMEFTKRLKDLENVNYKLVTLDSIIKKIENGVSLK